MVEEGIQQQQHTSPYCPLHIRNTHIHTTPSPIDLWTVPFGVASLLVTWADLWVVSIERGSADFPLSDTGRKWVNNKKGWHKEMGGVCERVTWGQSGIMVMNIHYICCDEMGM